MEEMEFNFGDKIYYIDKESDGEVEGYVVEEIEGEVYKIKIRKNRSIAFIKKTGLTKIFPEYWESLEENLIEDSMEYLLKTNENEEALEDKTSDNEV